MTHPIKFAFFGGEPLAVPVLEELKTAGLLPSLVVCNPDRPTGRKQIITPPPAKVWSEIMKVDVFQPTTYKDDSVRNFLSQTEWDVFVVVAYNFILPKWLIDIPKYGVINVHPSLLPKLRGASPIRTAIIENQPENVGVSIMLMDEKMDHGPILKQEKLIFNNKNWPIYGPELDKTLAQLGGKLLTTVLPDWVAGKISSQEQNHHIATYCSKFTKENSEIQLNPFDLPAGEAGRHAWFKINAFAGIGDTFFIHNGTRVKIKKAELSKDNSLYLLSVIPEGKKEISFQDYLKNYGSK
jgi:methionyl-tRNA formyltransferase